MGKKKTSAAAKKARAASAATSTSTAPTPSTSMNGTHDTHSDDELPPLMDADTPLGVPPADETDEQKRARAEATKEQGNVAFKAKRYADALALYSTAVDLNPAEAAYLTNRAAAAMALKRFRPALADCQAAVALQAAAPQAKTLVRLAKCQQALGQYTAALSTLRTALDVDPTHTPAEDLQKRVRVLAGHLESFETARSKGQWPMARLSLDQAFRAQEAEGGDIPVQWRLWRVEVEIARGGWDAATSAVSDALRLESTSVDVLAMRARILYLTGKLPQALQHAMEALRLDPGSETAQQIRRTIKDVERLKEEGNTAFKAGRLQDAARLYTETLDRIGEREEDGKGGPIRATLLSNRATTYLKMDRHADALTDIDASIALAPGSFKALRTRARLHLHAEKYDSAIADFNAALEQAQMEGADADVKALRADVRKAEVALKRSKTKDYYKILGVDREAGDADLKKAYRRESLKHHPDKGGDEEQFKLVAEAWGVLSDPQRRRRYDLGEDEDGQSAGMGGMGGMDGGDLADLFAQFHGGGFPGGGFGGGGHTHGFGGGFPGGMGGGRGPRAQFRSSGGGPFGF